MPVAMVRAYQRALPKLVAEEMRRDALTTAWGSGNMSPADTKSFIRDLEKTIDGETKKRKRATNQELQEMFGGKG